MDYLFHKTGPLKGKPRGYAFVEYTNKEVSPASSEFDKRVECEEVGLCCRFELMQILFTLFPLPPLDSSFPPHRAPLFSNTSG